jgi:sodium/pantothenate symporter
MGTTNWGSATAILLTVYAAVLLFFVVRAARRTKSLSDYAVGSQGFSPVVVGLSLAAGVTSAATFIINPGFVALYGWSAFLAMGIVLPIGMIGSLIVLTRSFRRYGSSVKALTLSQWMGKRYESPGFARWFAVLSLLLITFIVLICVGMTKVIASALGAGELPVLLGLVCFVFGYMMFGGANSLVYTNTIQAVLMLIVAAVMLSSGGEHFSAGIAGFWDKLAALDPALTQSVNPKSLLFRDWFEVVFCNFIVGVAIVCQPHIVTRSLMLRDERDVNRYLLVGITAQIVFFAVIFTGFYARLQFPDLTVNGAALKMDGIIPAYVVAAFPVGAGLLVILGLLSAGLSTLEGLIQSVSTTITADLIDPLAGPVLGEGEQRARRLSILNKLVIVVLAVVSAVWSYDQLLHPNLSVGILAQNGVYAFFSAAFVPVLFGIYLKNTSRLAPVAASVTAVVVHFAVYYGGLTPYTSGAVRNPAVAAALAILSSVVVGLAVHFFRTNPSPKGAGPISSPIIPPTRGVILSESEESEAEGLKNKIKSRPSAPDSSLSLRMTPLDMGKKTKPIDLTPKEKEALKIT